LSSTQEQEGGDPHVPSGQLIPSPVVVVVVAFVVIVVVVVAFVVIVVVVVVGEVVALTAVFFLHIAIAYNHLFLFGALVPSSLK